MRIFTLILALVLCFSSAESAKESEGVFNEISGAGLITDLIGTVDVLLPGNRFVINAEDTIFTDPDSEYSGGLNQYSDMKPGMVVKTVILWQANGTLLAQSVEFFGFEADLITLEGGITRELDEPGFFEVETGEVIFFGPDCTLDGDVTSVDQIGLGSKVNALCLPSDNFGYFAIWAEIRDESFLEWTEDPFSIPGGFRSGKEAILSLAEGADPAIVAQRFEAEIIGTLPGTLVHLFRWQRELESSFLYELLDDPEILDLELHILAWDLESTRRRLPTFDAVPNACEYRDQTAVNLIDIKDAHKRTVGTGTLVAVLDTGVDPLHPLLRHSIAEGGWDFVDNDNAPWETMDNLNQDGDDSIDEAAGHGTFVAGLIRLVAPGAKILPYRVLNDDGVGTTFAFCRAVLAAIDQGADVINMSFAQGLYISKVLDRIIDDASRRGVVFVAGAGNDSSSQLFFPAWDHRVIAVAALDNDGSLADFSNYGPEVALGAPGVGLYSGLMEFQYGRWSGTSMAAPLVTGTVALLRSVNHRLGPKQIEAALLQSAKGIQADAEIPKMLQVSAALNLVPDPQHPTQLQVRRASSRK